MSSPTPPTSQNYAVAVGTSSNDLATPLYLEEVPSSTLVNYPVGKRAIVQSTNHEYTLTSKTATLGVITANWQVSAGGSSILSTLSGDTGTASPVAGNINLFGTASEIVTAASGDDVTFSLSPTLIAPGSLEVTSGFTVDAGAITMQSGTSAISISTDAAATTVNIATGAGAKTATFGSSDTTSTTSIACGTGGIGVGASANAHTTTVGSTTGNSATSIACGTGGCALGASANAHTTTVGSTTTTSTTVVQSGTGGIALNAAGLVSVAPAANAGAGTTLGINSRVCTAQFTGQTTAAAGTLVLTITNTLLTDVTQAIMYSVCNLGSNDAQMTVYRVEKIIGSVVFTLHNSGAAALNGDVYITLWLLN